MSKSLVSEWDDAGEFHPDGHSAGLVGAERRAPVRCLLSVDPYLSRPVHEAVLDRADRWRVCEVVDGLDAVHVAGSAFFDIIVLDLRLPVLDGYSAASRICAVGAGARAWSAFAVILVVDSVHELPVSPSIPGAQLRVLFRDSPNELIRSAMSWVTGLAEGPVPALPRPVEPTDGEPGERTVARPLDQPWARPLDRPWARPLDQPWARPLDQPWSRPLDQPWARLLSVRERQVLVSLCLGQSNRQLASALSVSEATVKTHVSHLLAKLGLSSRVEAVVFAYENGIVVPGRRRRTA